jgi:hypothetical protein
MLTQSDEAEAERLLKLAQQDVLERWKQYERMAAMNGKQEAESRRQ